MCSCRAERLGVALLSLCLTAAGLGCTEETSQLLVLVDSNLSTDVEPPVAGDGVLRAVRVEVCDESCDDPAAARTERFWAVTSISGSPRVNLPFSFGVAPFGHDPSRSVDIRIEARRRAQEEAPDAVLFTVRRRVAFERGQTVRVPIFLAAACIGVDCPSGSTCNAVGECEPDDVLPAEDAGVGADAGTDAGPDDGCVTPVPPGPLPELELENARSLEAASGTLTAMAAGADDSLLVAGRVGTMVFVRRLGPDGGAPRWDRPIPTDASFLWFGQVTDLVEHGGNVYGAGVIGETWTLGALTAQAPAPSFDESDSRRHGLVLFALTADTGMPVWVHVLKWRDVTDVASGLVVDDDGIALVSYAIGGTVSDLELDGEPWPSSAPRRGLPAPRATLFRFEHDGTPRSLLGISDHAPVNEVALATAGAGDLVLWIVGPDARANGLDMSTASGDIIGARIRPDDGTEWIRSVGCDSGSWRVNSVEGAVVGERSWFAFSTNADASCGRLRVSGPGLAPELLTRSAGGADFIGVLALETCSGDPVEGSLWSAGVPSAPYVAVSSVSADERGLVIGGTLGHGGVNFGGDALPGLDTGSGTDGFLVGIDASGEHAFSELFGGTGVGAGPDDTVGSVLLRENRVYAGGGFTGAHIVDGISVPSGPVLLTYGPPG